MRNLQKTASDTFISSVVTITPDMAREWIDNNVCNRKIVNNRIATLANEMLSGRWVLNHQGIAFYKDGELADGQHRLYAIRKAGVPIEMVVTYGVDRGAVFGIDQHRARSTYDAIKISGSSCWIGSKEIQMIKFMTVIASDSHSTLTISPKMALELAESVKDRLLFANHILNGKIIKGLTTIPTAVAFILAMGYENECRLIEFAEVLKSGMPSSKDDVAAIKYRDWAINTTNYGTEARISSLRRAQRAIKAFCEKEQLMYLRDPLRLIYPVPNELRDKPSPSEKFVDIANIQEGVVHSSVALYRSNIPALAAP